MDPVSTGERRRTWFAVLLIGVVAIIPRVCNLGSFSLWRDEVFTMKLSSMPLLDMLSACAADANNPPLYAVITHISLLIGLVDPWIRLIPIVAAVASIGLLAVWTHRHFGRSAALLVAVFCALSPFHICYSQELRAYPYLLLVSTLTLVVVDRVRSNPDWRSALALAATVAVGFYTNLTYALVLVPAAGMVVAVPPSRRDGDAVSKARIRTRFLVGVCLGLLAFMPWMWWIWSPLRDKISRAPSPVWTLEAIGDRWLELTIAPGFNGFAWFGVILAGIFVVGVIIASRTAVGRAVLLPAMAALVAWEAGLVFVGRWTSARYDTAVWPFLAILVALGFEQVLRWLRWRRLQWAVCAAAAVMLVVHIDLYQRHGRRHWDLVADAVREVRRPDERLVAADYFARNCLSFYLDEEVPTVNKKLFRLRAHLDESPSLLVASKYRLRSEDLNALCSHAEISRVHRTAWLYRLRRTVGCLTEESPDCKAARPGPWPGPVAEPVAERLERQPTGCLGRLLGRSLEPKSVTVAQLDFSPRDRRRLRSGWNEATTRADGTTLARVLGREANVDIGLGEPMPGRITIRLWPNRRLAGSLWIRVLLNGRELGVRPLKPWPRVIGFDVPTEVWRSGRDLLVLQFSEVCREDGSGRQRSAAVDWIEWTPR